MDVHFLIAFKKKQIYRSFEEKITYNILSKYCIFFAFDLEGKCMDDKIEKKNWKKKPMRKKSLRHLITNVHVDNKYDEKGNSWWIIHLSHWTISIYL